MKRKIQDLISYQGLIHLKYIPIIIFKLKNWFPFILNYIGVTNPDKELYVFRNKVKMQTSDTIDAATMAVVFFKKDYGESLDNSTIIDIGANIGSYSVFAATTSQNTKIYAYEPMQQTYDSLVKNIEINKLQDKIIPYKLGICAKKETKKLFLIGRSPYNSLYSHKNHNEYVEINCISLQDVFDENKIEHCDILKMDCEGAEFEIFYATPKHYLDKINEIRMEYHNIDAEETYNIKDLTIFLKKGGFKVVKKNSDTNHSGTIWFRKED